MPGVWSHAATALRNVCARCTSRLQDAATPAPLIDHTERCMPQPGQPGLSLEDRTAVVQGLARVVATLAPAECAGAGARLLVRKNPSLSTSLLPGLLELMGIGAATVSKTQELKRRCVMGMG